MPDAGLPSLVPAGARLRLQAAELGSYWTVITSRREPRPAVVALVAPDPMDNDGLREADMSGIQRASGTGRIQSQPGRP